MIQSLESPNSSHSVKKPVIPEVTDTHKSLLALIKFLVAFFFLVIIALVGNI